MSEGLAADKRLHPASFGISFIKSVPQFVVGFPAIAAFSSDAGLPLALALIGVGAVAALGMAYLAWTRFRYGVGTAEIVIESGIFQRRRRIIPFDRVQDIDIEQALLARLFGTVTVRIETGGGSKDEGRLEAVTRAEAHRLRDIIRTRGATAIANEPDAPPEPLLFEMKLARLLLAGLFNFSLIFLALIGVVIENLQPFLRARGIDVLELFGFAQAAAGQVTLAASLFLIALLVLLGTLTGVIRTVMRDYRFRLWRTPTGLRRKRGLFTRSEVVIPIGRIQLGLLRSGLIGRLFGWMRLEYQTLNAAAGKSGHQAAAPFARIEEILPILAETGHADLPPPESYVQVSRRSVARRSARYALPLIPAAIAAGIMFRPGFLVLALFPLAIGAAVLGWKRHRYAVTETALLVSQGLLSRHLWIVPFERVQTIAVSRSPFQRALGLASLTVDTAGARAFHYPVILDVDRAIAKALSDRLLERHKAARLAQRGLVRYPG